MLGEICIGIGTEISSLVFMDLGFFPVSCDPSPFQLTLKIFYIAPMVMISVLSMGIASIVSSLYKNQRGTVVIATPSQEFLARRIQVFALLSVRSIRSI
jgi:hypothetical protein